MTDKPIDNSSEIKRLTEKQHGEATLHWTRNGFFLISSSILLLALSQFKTEFLMIAFGVMGLFLNSVWLLIQWRSSSYIDNYKSQVQKLEESSTTKTYSKEVKGIQMRHLAMILPVPYLIIWASVIIQAILNIQASMPNTQSS